MNHLDRFLASYRNDTVWGDKDPGEAVRAAIENVWPLRPDYAKAELYARMMERWDNYPSGVPRKVFVQQTIRGWEYWYVRSTPPVEVPKESVADIIKKEK